MENKITLSKVKQLGFSAKLIELLLPEPKLVDNPFYKHAAPMKLWNEKDVKTFIETMKKKEDMWTPDQVISMYGNMSLEEALKDRNAHMNTMLEELHKNLHGDTMLTGLNIH